MKNRLALLPALLLLCGFSLESARKDATGLEMENLGAFVLPDTKKPEKLPLLHKASAPARNDFESARLGIARSDQKDPQDYDWILKPEPRHLTMSAPGRFFLTREGDSLTLTLWAISENFKKAEKVRDTDYTFMQASPVRGLLVAGRPSPDKRGFNVAILSSVDGKVLTTFANAMPATGGKLVGLHGNEHMTVRLHDGKTGLVAMQQEGEGKLRYAADAGTLPYSWDSLHEVDGLRFGLFHENGQTQLDIFNGAGLLPVEDGIFTRLVRLHATERGMTHTLASELSTLPYSSLPDDKGQAFGWALETMRGDGDRVWQFLDMKSGTPSLDPTPWKDLSIESQGHYGVSRKDQFLVAQRLDGQWVPIPVQANGQRGNPQHEYAAPAHNKLMAMANRRNDINGRLSQEYKAIITRAETYKKAMESGDSITAKVQGMQISNQAYINAILKFGAANGTEKATAKAWARSLGGNTYATVIDKLGTSDYLEASRAADAASDPALRKRLSAVATSLKDSHMRSLNPHLYAPQVAQANNSSSSNWDRNRPLPFSGIGSSGARPLSTLEKDRHDNSRGSRPYEIRSRAPAYQPF